MKPSTKRLLEAAKHAAPKPHPRAKYDEHAEVVAELVEKRNFTVQAAVEWLFENKAPGVTKVNIPLIAGALRRRFQRARLSATNQTTLSHMQPNTEIITQEHGDALTIIVPGAESLPPSLLANIEEGFRDSFAQAEKWRLQALAIKVTSPDQKAEMKLARTIRLELKDIRVNAEKKRKALKEDSLRLGKAIDGVNNLLLAAIEPLERHLEEQEKFAERLIAEQRAKLQADRSQALAPYLAAGQVVPPLDAMTEEQWAGYLSDAKLLHEAKIERERREEAERIAREQAEAAERERLRIENERLQREAAEREAKAKAEREAAERELARIKAEAEAAAAKERAERERLERELAEQKAAEEAKIKAEAAARRKAAAAPDKAKLRGVATSVRAIFVPETTTDEAAPVRAEIVATIESFAKWIETQTECL